jgi:hypothetical protein
VSTQTFSDYLVAPLLLQIEAAKPYERGIRWVEQIDCFGLLDCFVERALEQAAAPGYQFLHSSYLNDVRRDGERLPLAAAIWTRRVLRHGTGRACGPGQRGRLRLRHFGSPTSFHLEALVDELKQLSPQLAATISTPFLAAELFNRPVKTPAGAILKAAAALQGGSLTTPEQLAATAGRALFTAERVALINGGKAEAEKARALVRKKIREALREGRTTISLNSGHLTATGNSQITAVVQVGLSLWLDNGIDPEEKIHSQRLISLLAEVCDERVLDLYGDFPQTLQKKQLIRSRPSGLADLRYRQSSLAERVAA